MIEIDILSFRKLLKSSTMSKEELIDLLLPNDKDDFFPNNKIQKYDKETIINIILHEYTL